MRRVFINFLLSAMLIGLASNSFGGIFEPNPCLQMFFPFVYDEMVPDLRQRLVADINAGRLSEYGKNFKAEIDVKHSTIRVFSKLGRVFSGARERILWLHGLGGTTSRHTSMLELITQLDDPIEVNGRKIGKSGSTKRKIRNLNNFVQIASEAIDLPGTLPPHGVGPNMLNYRKIEDVVEWLESYIRDAKAAAPHLPLTIGAKSASPLFVLAALPKIRGLVDRIVFISPALPNTDPELRKQQREGLKKAVEEDGVKIEWDVIKWIDSLNLREPWSNDEFMGIPTLILTGSKDAEIIDQERIFYQKLAVYCSPIRANSIC